MIENYVQNNEDYYTNLHIYAIAFTVVVLFVLFTFFLKEKRELEKKDYENVLVACHGGIMRPLCGYLTNRRNGLMWRPRPTNCEIRVFESLGGRHRMLDDIIMNPENSKI